MTILHDDYIVIFLGVCVKMFNKDKILEIDNDYSKIKDFDKDSLFLNIYHFWCFANLSIYYIWR